MDRFLVLIAVIALVMAGISAGQEHKGGEKVIGKDKQAANDSPVPLILQEDDGDHLVHRAGPLGGVPFTIKVDSQFGKSEDFFVFTETLAAGQTIPFHKHHNAEEILLFEDSGATVIVGNKAGKADANSLVFIPRDMWISATNRGSTPIRLFAIFSRHGFEQYMRAISEKPGETLPQLDHDELTRLRSLGHADYWDTKKGPYPPGVAKPE